MNKKILYIGSILLIAVGILAFNNYNRKKGLEENGIVTKAVITKIKTNTQDSEVTPEMKNLFISYQFAVNGKELSKTVEIPKRNMDQYFEENKKAGDTISIVYNSEKPNHSRISKLEEITQ